VAKHGVWHRQHDEQETKRQGGQQEPLNIPQRRRCKKRGKPTLQRSHPTQERWLEARTAARGLRHLEQQLPIRWRIAESGYHPVVAVDLDRKAQPTQLPPHGEIPRHQDQRERRYEKKARVVCSAVLLLVTDDILPLRSR
jgi:ribosomal protein L28